MPRIEEAVLSAEAKAYFQKVLKILDASGMSYEVDLILVRGLDYYTDTVFEFILESDDELGGTGLRGREIFRIWYVPLTVRTSPASAMPSELKESSRSMDKQNLFPDLASRADIVFDQPDEEAKRKSPAPGARFAGRRVLCGNWIIRISI